VKKKIKERKFVWPRGKFQTVTFLHEKGETTREESALEMERQCRVNSGAFLELNIEETSCWACIVTNLLGTKIEILRELHCSNKLVVVLFPSSFPNN